ncbi:MAG: glycosyltransferase family 4 protein [Myxococcota bacterium]
MESVGWHLAQELSVRGADVTVVFHRQDGPAPPRVALCRIPVARFWQPLRVRTFSERVARVVGAGFDVVHSLARTRQQDVYRAGGGSHAAYMEHVYRSPRLQALSPRHRTILGIEEHVFRRSAQIIQCNARASAVEIARRYDVPETRLVTIYNGVDTGRFHPGLRAALRDEVRRELNLEGPTALFVGSGFHRKGLDRAILGLAAGAPAGTTLLVAGRDNGRPWQRLARRHGVEPRVVLLGHRADVERLHAAADLFVLPTRYDPFSNACLEAMASGLPVATTPTNGAAELVEHRSSGLILEDRFEAAFALLAEPDRLAEMGTRARARAEACTWSNHAEQVLELYERVRR